MYLASDDPNPLHCATCPHTCTHGAALLRQHARTQVLSGDSLRQESQAMPPLDQASEAQHSCQAAPVVDRAGTCLAQASLPLPMSALALKAPPPQKSLCQLALRSPLPPLAARAGAAPAAFEQVFTALFSTRTCEGGAVHLQGCAAPGLVA